MVDAVLSLFTATGNRAALESLLPAFSQDVVYDGQLLFCRGRGRLLRAMQALGAPFERVEALPKLVRCCLRCWCTAGSDVLVHCSDAPSWR